MLFLSIAFPERDTVPRIRLEVSLWNEWTNDSHDPVISSSRSESSVVKPEGQIFHRDSGDPFGTFGLFWYLL